MGTDSLKPKPQSRDVFELFQAHFDQILNPDHELIQLAGKIGWSRFVKSRYRRAISSGLTLTRPSKRRA